MVRKIDSVPAPSGVIPYHDAVLKDGIMYSIDLFRPRIPLAWYNLKIVKGDKFIPCTDENVASTIGPILQKLWISRNSTIFCPAGKKSFSGGVFWWWQQGNLRISLHHFKPFGLDNNCFSLILEFNPNKIDEPDMLFVQDIISYFKQLLTENDVFVWDNTRCDFTIDVPYSIDDIRILSRKSSAFYHGTYYFGTRGSSGYIRVYDKCKQMLDIFHTDVSGPITRIEFEQRNGDSFVLDQPYLIGDLGQHQVLKYVPMHLWPEALRTFDDRTARKIKKSCLKEIPFDRSIFDDLYLRLLDRCGLSPDDLRINHHSESQMRAEDMKAAADREAARLEEIAQLERDQALLRKWANNKD